MRILCISDHVDPRIYSPNIRERFHDVDIIISSGDLPLSYYDYIVSMLNRPFFFVFGNHHLKHIKHYARSREIVDSNDGTAFETEHLTGGTCIDRRCIRCKGLLIAGLGGSRWYNGGKNQFRERAMYLRIFTMIPKLLWNRVIHGRYIDILVSHAAPYGIGDREDVCHRGFKAFLWFLNKFKPRYLIHGHIHLFDLKNVRERHHRETTVINAYDHILLDWEDRE